MGVTGSRDSEGKARRCGDGSCNRAALSHIGTIIFRLGGAQPRSRRTTSIGVLSIDRMVTRPGVSKKREVRDLKVGETVLAYTCNSAGIHASLSP